MSPVKTDVLSLLTAPTPGLADSYGGSSFSLLEWLVLPFPLKGSEWPHPLPLWSTSCHMVARGLQEA